MLLCCLFLFIINVDLATKKQGELVKMDKNKEIIIPEVVKEVNKANKNAIATIHNDLIQARHKLSLEEIRLMDTIISFIQPEDKDFKRYKIPVAVFKDLFGTQRKDIYDVVKRAVEGLLSKPIKIEKKNEKGKRFFEMFNFISYGRYEEGAGCFYISIAPEFKPYLLQLKEFFSKIPIKYTYVLNSRYAIRLYELLKQYENTGFRVDYLPELREMLGIEENEYPRFEAFERRVIKRAIKEINEKTDLEVSYTKKKTGRKITHIEFEVKSKKADTTETTKTPSKSLDTQGQKQAEKNYQPKTDLWANVLTILENRYNADTDDIDLLQLYVYPVYKTDTKPKKMVLHTSIEAEKGKQAIRETLKKYWEQLKEIVKIETFENYIPAISKSMFEKGKELPFD